MSVPQGQSRPIILSGIHTWPESVWAQQGPAWSHSQQESVLGPIGPPAPLVQCLGEPGWMGFVPSPPVVTLGPVNPGACQPGARVVAASPTTSALGLPQCSHTHCLVSRPQTWAGSSQPVPGAQEEPSWQEGCRSRRTSPGTAPSCSALCWHNPRGLPTP